MISIEKLRELRHGIFHANCPDGIAAALILKDALPDLRVSFVHYGTEEHKNFLAEPGQVWCDFSPPKERAAEFVTVGATVLDHHSRDVVEPYGEFGVFGENDRLECGAMLAFKHVWLPLHDFKSSSEADHVFNFAEFCAVRDTWKRDDARFQRARDVGELLLFWHTKLRLSHYLDLPPGPLPLAERLFERAEEHARKSIDEAHRFATSKGTRVLMFQGVAATSDAAEILEEQERPKLITLGETDLGVGPDGETDLVDSVDVDAEIRRRFQKTDLVAGFHYKVDAGRLQLQFSTRSHTGYDVSALARAHGGGGHRAAAGFTVEVSPEVGANPYAVFRLLLSEFEEGS